MIAAPDLNVLSILVAIGAGLLSFASPCVLPLVPVYLSYITGTSVAGARTSSSPNRFLALPPTLAFVGGLAVVFVLLGASATVAGRALAQYQPLITRVGGLAVIVFGLNMAGVIKVPWLFRTVQGDFSAVRVRGIAGAALMGVIFGAGWVPCVGPFLASILTLASQERTAEQGMLLLFSYALGLGLPFVVLGAAWEPALRWIQRIQRQLSAIEIVSGAVLVLLGCLLVTDQYAFLAGRLTEVFGIGLSV
ncbi:MAG TPA: cytochrome c biogenesis protein CcdA [Chloroflexota bacterium]|jgi:cytochrome c-type biogenesis protein|nr:cytochrome c biogenesis protein CcdA [Chloroflexota bacterium]